MSPTSQSITSKLRNLKSRHLNRAAYWRELIKLADLVDQTEAANELRGRIATLERRVRELEARK